jgi:hypothetical protein
MTTGWKPANKPGSYKGPFAIPHRPSGVSFSEGDHRVCKDGARLGGEGLPAPQAGCPIRQTGCPCGTTFVSVVSVVSIVSVGTLVSIVSNVSVVSVLKKRTRKSAHCPLSLHFGFLPMAL